MKILEQSQLIAMVQKKRSVEKGEKPSRRRCRKFVRQTSDSLLFFDRCINLVPSETKFVGELNTKKFLSVTGQAQMFATLLDKE
jgi:hypothetical protein